MRIPNPIATTTTEAYLAYRAGFLAQADLKEKLYHPYLHIDGWLAYWTGLTSDYPTDKNGDPECLTDEEAYIAYLAGVTSEYPEAIKDPADVRVASYLKYLISARFGRPDYPVTREEFYLSMMKPRFIPSGDPSSEIELDGTVEAPFVDLKMYGDTSQQTYSGKNLFNNKATPLFNNKASAEALPTGVRITTTTTTSGYCFVAFKVCDASDYEGQTITLKTNMASSSTNPARLYIGLSSADGGNRLAKVFLDASGSCSYTIEQDPDRPCVMVALYSTNSSNPVIDEYVDYTDLQIEVGSTATSYEPYVGGVPSPNPNYPQNVNVVTGRQVVGVRSKNLIDNNHLEYLATNANTDTIILSSLPTGIRWEYTGGGSPWLLFKVMDLRGYEGKTIRMSAKFDDNGTEYRIMTTNEDGTGRNSAAISNTSGETISYTVPNELGERHFLGYRIGAKAQSVSNFTDLIMTIDEEDMEYSPYGADYEINLGKNLFTFGYGSGKFQGITWTRNGDTAVGVGTATGNYTDAGTRIDLPAPLKAGQDYVFSIPTAVSFRCSLYLFDKNDQVISPAVRLSPGETSEAFSKEVDIYKARITLSDYGGAGKELNVELRAQIELGSTATGYAPQFEPIELCKIGDYQDYIYRDEDGDWYVHKAIGKYVFDGAENWATEPYGTNSWRVSVISIYDFNADEVQLKCDFANGVPFNNRGLSDATKTCVCYTNATSALIIRNTMITAKEAMQTNTAGKKLFYKATPTDTQITNSELISQLDALMEGGSYNDKTYIKVTATDPNLPGLLYVEAAV